MRHPRVGSGPDSSRSVFQMGTISFALPDSVELHLATLSDNVDAAAKEAAVVELYRQGQLSHGALAECLGVSRTEVDGLLGRGGSHRHCDIGPRRRSSDR